MLKLCSCYVARVFLSHLFIIPFFFDFKQVLTDVKKFAKGVRSHWAIENNLHWCLDVLFCDDECTVLDRNAAENLAIIRRIVYNRIKMLSKVDTLSMGKRACIYDDEFRAQILFSC